MAGDDIDQIDASEGAHTLAKNSGAVDAARAAKVGIAQATVEAAMADLAAGIERPADAEQASLLLDEMDEQLALFSGPVKHVADTIRAARGPGRPRGSQNKSSFRDVLLRMGFKHPGLNLAAMANADPHRLAVELAGLPLVEGLTGTEMLMAYRSAGALKSDQVIALVKSAHDLMRNANAELLPYFESKRPTEIHIEERKLGVMIVGDMRTDRGADAAFISLTEVDKPE